MTVYVRLFVALVGVACFYFGLWLVWPPLTFIVLGIMLASLSTKEVRKK